MAKHNVQIAIKARDEASRKLKLIGKSAMGMGSMIRKAAAMVAVYFGARGMYRFMKSSVVAAAEQEKADTLLAQSLRNVGAEAQSAMVRLKAYASQVQSATIYGDEQVQQLMSLALNLGVTSDKIEEATKTAIGLTSIMGGKLGLEESTKYTALALQGEFMMLRRYIPELRQTTDVTEQLAIVQAKGAEGFKLAKEEARKGLGPLIQMKLAIGDVKEKIGAALLPTVQKCATRIKEWCEKNKERIGVWAEKTVAYLALVKDLFVEFGKFIKDDWKEAFRVGLDFVLTEVKAWGASLMIIMEKIFVDLENNIGVWIKRGAAQKIAFGTYEKQYLQKHGAWGGGGMTKEAQEYHKRRAKEYAQEMLAKDRQYGLYEKMFPTLETSTWKQVGEEIIAVHKEMLGEFVDRMPENWGKRINNIISDFQHRFREIGMGAGLIEGLRNKIFASLSMMGGLLSGGPLGALGSVPNALATLLGIGGGPGGSLAALAATKKGGISMREAPFLTFAPGGPDPLTKIERSIREQIRIQNKQERHLQRIANAERYKKRQSKNSIEIRPAAFKE